MSQWTLTLNLDIEDDRVMFQRIAHIDSLCSIIWRLKYGNEQERLGIKDMGKLYRMEIDEGVVIEELWS